MASLFKRGDIWWVKYYVHGKPVSKSLKTASKPLATREKQAIEAKLLEPQRSIPTAKNPICEAFWTKYLAYAKAHKRPNTITSEQNHWNQLLECTQAQRLGDITSEKLELFKTWKQAKGHSPITINCALRDTRTIFSFAIKLKLYSGKNPVEGVAFHKVTRTLPKFHSEQQLGKLLEATRKRSRQLEWVVLLGAHAGLRKIEIVSARWDWFDFEKKADTPKTVPRLRDQRP